VGTASSGGTVQRFAASPKRHAITPAAAAAATAAPMIAAPPPAAMSATPEARASSDLAMKTPQRPHEQHSMASTETPGQCSDSFVSMPKGLPPRAPASPALHGSGGAPRATLEDLHGSKARPSSNNKERRPGYAWAGDHDMVRSSVSCASPLRSTVLAPWVCLEGQPETRQEVWNTLRHSGTYDVTKTCKRGPGNAPMAPGTKAEAWAALVALGKVGSIADTIKRGSGRPRRASPSHREGTSESVAEDAGSRCGEGQRAASARSTGITQVEADVHKPRGWRSASPVARSSRLHWNSQQSEHIELDGEAGNAEVALPEQPQQDQMAARKESVERSMSKDTDGPPDALTTTEKSNAWRAWKLNNSASGDIAHCFRRGRGEFSPPRPPAGRTFPGGVPPSKVRVTLPPHRSVQSPPPSQPPSWSSSKLSVVRPPSKEARSPSPGWKSLGLFESKESGLTSPQTPARPAPSMERLSPPPRSRPAPDKEVYYGSPMESAQSRGIVGRSPPREMKNTKNEVWQAWESSKAFDVDQNFKRNPGLFSPVLRSSIRSTLPSRATPRPQSPRHAARAEARGASDLDSGNASKAERPADRPKSSWRETAPPELVAALGRPEQLTKRTVRALQAQAQAEAQAQAAQAGPPARKPSLRRSNAPALATESGKAARNPSARRSLGSASGETASTLVRTVDASSVCSTALPIDHAARASMKPILAQKQGAVGRAHASLARFSSVPCIF